LAFLGAHNGVAVLQWPRDCGHVEVLSRAGLPRLLLVHPSPSARPVEGPLQRVLPLSARDDEIHWSLVALADLAAEQRSRARTPVIDGRGWIRTPGGRVELPPVALRLAAGLLADFGRPVSDDVLARATPCPPMTARALQGHLARLSRLVNPLGLEVVVARDGHHTMRWCAAGNNETCA
jgi:hypothetical protein